MINGDKDSTFLILAAVFIIKSWKRPTRSLKQGEQLPTCDMCKAYGELMARGVKWEEVVSDNVFVMLMYSDNPEVVNEIHAVPTVPMRR